MAMKLKFIKQMPGKAFVRRFTDRTRSAKCSEVGQFNNQENLPK
jgi:hypothetical protein